MLERCSAVETIQGFSTAETRLLLHGTDERPMLLGLDQKISRSAHQRVRKLSEQQIPTNLLIHPNPEV